MQTSLPNRRGLADANQVITTLLPVANTNVNSASIDLTQSYSLSELLAVQVDVDACPNLTSNANSVTFVLQDSADNSNFANIPELGTTVLIGVPTSGTGSTLATFGGLDQIKLPPSTRQYIRLQAVTTAGAGNNAASNFYLSLRF